MMFEHEPDPPEATDLREQHDVAMASAPWGWPVPAATCTGEHQRGWLPIGDELVEVCRGCGVASVYHR